MHSTLSILMLTAGFVVPAKSQSLRFTITVHDAKTSHELQAACLVLFAITPYQVLHVRTAIAVHSMYSPIGA